MSPAVSSRSHSSSEGRPSSASTSAAATATSATTSADGRPVVLTSGQGSRTLLPQTGDVLSIEVEWRNPRRRFPLADELLPRVAPLSPEQRAALKRRCLQEVNRVVAKHHAVWAQSDLMFDGGDTSGWKTHLTRPQLTVYRRKRATVHTAQRFLARGHVTSLTLRDAEYGLYCDSTTSERAVKTDLFGELCLDAAVLQVFERQTEADPFHFFGIKWLALVSPVDKLISPRDYAFVEYSCRVEPANGAADENDAVLVRVLLPVDPELVSVLSEREYDLVRGAMACTYMYRYDASARALQVFAEGSIDPSGSATAWLSKSFLSLFAPTVVNLEHCADVKHLMAYGRVLRPDEFQARVAECKAANSKHCVACLKNMSSSAFAIKSLKRAPTYCRSCGERVCSRCVMSLTLCLPWHEKRNAEHPSAVIEEKFCLKCICIVRAHRNDDGPRLGMSQASMRRHGSSSKLSSSLSEHEMAAEIERLSLALEQQRQHHDQEEAPLNGSRLVQDRVRQLRERHRQQDRHHDSQYASSGLYYSDLDTDDDEDYAASAYRAGPASVRGRRHEAAPQYWTDQSNSSKPPTAAFDRMERSIAEQEALLRTLRFEHMRHLQRQKQALGYSSSGSWKAASTSRLESGPASSLASTARMTIDISSDEEVYEVGRGYSLDSPSARSGAPIAAAFV
ncbi:hypothetical protein P43SY_001433 [Pythium insidiosum]|uniref:FYVE-type domain-containing protein n=1 Tax=Pythium insidiosum TaxID=114742 RepID=A0AAD5QDJ0_PYTIN|nr:hypothetical protein P43SY_001433 [Pythium insidiosum]